MTSVLMSYEAQDGEHHLDSHFLALTHLQGKADEECRCRVDLYVVKLELKFLTAAEQEGVQMAQCAGQLVPSHWIRRGPFFVPRPSASTYRPLQ